MPVGSSQMKLRCQTLAAMVLTAGLVALAGCARHSAARIEIVSTEKAVSKAAVAAQADKSPPARQTGTSTFPADQGGPLLRDLLGPPVRLEGDGEARPGPRPQPAPREVAKPELPTALGKADLPRRTLKTKGTRLQPHSPAEEAPLANQRTDPRPTSRQEMRGGALIRVPSRDVNLPPALPILGVLTVDRVPLEDPTTGESAKAALAATPPIRSNPAPFVPRNLPDPFENGQTVKLRPRPEEDRAPSSGPVRPPKP